MAINGMLNRKIAAQKVMRAADLAPYVSSGKQLRRMAETGELIAIGAGIYAHPSMDPFTASVIAIARFYPKAIISNITALAIHGLTDERIDRIDVDIPTITSIRNKLVFAHRVPDKHLVGVIRMNFHDHKIRIYDKERALCDAYRIDPDGPIFLKAVKRYVKAGKIDPDRIAKYDKILSTKALRSITQELADE
jgi:predicted transcriptional regulator of viral defense system